ncbi:unnamed protein product [Danaus chrysippus]|uniref:(African queen) hypothetical protein n=1 Tax=Danaus chrysippus TaxID=151541 RepID=A0A8J2QFN6_9NEOP|nr:unnamed protein product [Danaus chrysippus]
MFFCQQETVQSSGGKVTSSRFNEEFDVDQCWDERVLKKLLEESSDYEQRRRLRARIRTLMAEQEACASAVTEALAAAGESTETEDQSGERGESLLLPLLQGLLQGGGQRLLAGLGAASHDVVADVRRSLQRLRVALAPPNDHPQARALLTLADRLEEALDAADRLDGCKRKTRRRSRTSRHTVGVTREELEEARRIVDRDQLLPEPINPQTPNTPSMTSRSTSEENPSTPERKQSIDEHITFHNASEERQKTVQVPQHASINSVAKVNRDANIVERRVPNNRKPDFFRHSIADVKPEPPKSPAERWHSETKSSIAAIAQKFNGNLQKEAPIRRAPLNRPTVTIHSKTDEESKHASFYRPPPPGYNFAAPQPTDDLSKPLNRFSNNNSKRMRMKRANTIDIGKPLGGYKYDREDDENTPSLGPKVPEFQPQTENDRKFLAFMQKNENMNRSPGTGQANWSNRFGNIKNAFENRDREDNIRASSASSAKRFWKTTNENSATSNPRPRKFLADVTSEIVKPPWTSQRRDSLRTQPNGPQAFAQSSVAQTAPLQKKQNVVQKPFVAKPIPVNQFSHAPMSAFKPPQKITSPISVVPNVWSPPSSNIPVSPSVEYPPAYPVVSNPLSPGSGASNSFVLHDVDKNKKVNASHTPQFEKENQSQTVIQPKIYAYGFQPSPPTHVRPQAFNYPIKPIPSQNNLAAPELVKKLGEPKSIFSPEPYSPKLDAQQLQIEFYERQIREKHRRDAINESRDVPLHKPPPPPAQSAYTIVDYTPQNVPATFVPLQQTPDIEKAKAHKVDYLPDVVMNEKNSFECNTPPGTRMTSASPSKKKVPQEHQNGDTTLKDETTTEHDCVVTRVMRGPIRGTATITTGVRTRHSEGAADSLRGVLDKLTSPKNNVITQIEKKKQEGSRSQVRLVAPQSIRPGLSPPHASLSPRPSNASDHDGYPRSPAGLRSPALAASRESVFSSESPGSRGSSPGSALARSGSWHRFGDSDKMISSKRVVARTKSMHLLAVPKLFEGGIPCEELPDKKRTVEAYFSKQSDRQSSSRTSGSQASPVRVRTTRSSQQQSFALGRSRTMPAVSELQFLDESNADDAFEDLVSALA